MFKKIIKVLFKGSLFFDKIVYSKSNVFNTSFEKNILLSYIETPFRKDKNENYGHSNYREVKMIANVFKDFGFNIDVYNFLYAHDINYSKYDLLFGFGKPFENSFYDNYNGKRIFYATGAHSSQRNNAEILRLKKLKERKGQLLSPKRIKPYRDNASAILSDAIISLGNSWTISTYKKFYNGPIYNIPVTAYNFQSLSSIQRNWELAKKSFLWIGSSGLVHKGLDLCLDAFCDLSNINFHICGPKEKDFFNLYHEELHNHSNIHYHGFIDISSARFKNIVEECGFVIFPSCSEAGGGACLTGMFTGLVPVVTEESSINISDFGFLINESKVEKIKEIILEVSKLDDNELKERSKLAYEYCSRVHTLNNFRKRLKNIIGDLIIKWKI